MYTSITDRGEGLKESLKNRLLGFIVQCIWKMNDGLKCTAAECAHLHKKTILQ